MKTRWLILALLSGLVVSTVPDTQAVSEKADSARISRLISQLASVKFSERQRASRELEAIGEPALNALRTALRDKDPETCHRATGLVARIEKRLDTADVLVPTRVRLVCKDMPVPAAIAELARKTGIEILIDPKSQATLAQRKVTLDTGEVTFWEAFDALCQKAGLVETTWQNPPIHGGYTTIEVPQGIIVPFKPLKPVILPAQPAIKLLPQKPKEKQVQPQKPKEARPQPEKPKDGQAQPQKPKDVKAQPQKPKDVKAQPQKPKALPARPANRAALPRQVIQKAQAQLQLQRFQARQVALLDLRAYEVVQPPDYSRLVVADGKPETAPTCYAGAFRIRARTSAGKDKRAPGITFEVTAEPRHLGWNIVGTPRLDRADDDRGQTLTLLMEQNPHNMPSVVGGWAINGRMAAGLDVYVTQHVSSVPLKRTVSIQVKLGEKSGKLKHLAGQITVETKTGNQALIIVDKILTAGGKTTRGIRGGSIKVIEVVKDKNGNHQVRFKLENPLNSGSNLPTQVGGIMLANGRIVKQMAGQGPAAAGTFALVDAKGVPFPLIGSSITNNNGEIVQALTFRTGKDREPAKLIYYGQRNVTVDVPFTFKDLKLP